MVYTPSLNGSRVVTNYYSGGGATRIKKTDSQLGSRYYAYEGINPLCEYDSTGTVKKKYVYAFGRCIAYVDSSGAKYWLHQDALGSVKVVTNANGDTVSTYKYYPFGDSLLTRGTSKNDVQFTGKQNIAGIEAYDFSARYYDPELGRFYSIDPMGSAATSPYAYCSNDPVNRVDPTGMVDQSAGYPKGWTDFRYNRWEAWDMYNNRGRGGQIVGGEDGSMDFGGAPNWGLWRGSSQSYTQHLRSIGHPDYDRWYQNEIDSYWMSDYRNRADYDVTNANGTHTYTFWNVVTQSSDTWTGYLGLTFHWYGNFGGPNYSAGQYQPESMTTDEQFEEVKPKDQTDGFFKDHDKSIRDNPKKTPTHDLVLARKLITMSPFQKCYWLAPIPAPFQAFAFATFIPLYHLIK